MRVREPKGRDRPILTWSRKTPYGDYMDQPKRVVGVRELKSKLSAFLRRVAAGETVVIGDRAKRPMARIVPVSDPTEDATIERLIGLGRARAGVGKPGSCERVRPTPGARDASDIVVEERR